MGAALRANDTGTETSADTRRVHVAIVGTGFSGIGMAIALKRAGIDDFVLFERAGDVGGTWRDNTYPGCQCDVPSHLYSFSFKLNPDWSRTYSPQPEIFEYLRRCTRETGVMPHIRFNHEVTGAAWSEEDKVWQIETSKGSWIADVCITGNGGLAEPSIPPIEGIDTFEGSVWHSAAWDHNSEMKGRKVAVIGTGASAIQITPRIQPHVKSLHVFQRTPAWVMPHTDRPTRSWERKLYKRLPILQRLVRGGIYLAREVLVVALAKNPKLTKPLRAVALRHLRKSIDDPELRRKLRPTYSPGCKRLLLSNDFYPSLTASNVELVTEGIESINASSIVSRDGTKREVDTIIFATGFRVTNNPMMKRIRGRGGRSLAEVWSENGMRAYLGTTVADFPNLFMLTGPNTGQGHTSLLVMIEAQIRYVLSGLRLMRDRAVDEVEVRPDVVENFNLRLQAKMSRTVWTMGGCASWYLDDKGRNTTIWPDFTWRFRRLTARFDPGDYQLHTRSRSLDSPDAQSVVSA